MASEEKTGTTATPATLTWTVWPAAKRPWLSGFVVVFCLALAGGAWWSFGSKWYALITLVVLAVALGAHFFPTRYTVDAGGVRVRRFLYDRQRPWEAFRVCFVMRNGLLLSYYGSPASPFTPDGPELPRSPARFWKCVQGLDLPPTDAEAIRAYVGERVPLREGAEVQAWLRNRR